jgi:hypothetical protein
MTLYVLEIRLAADNQKNAYNIKDIKSSLDTVMANTCITRLSQICSNDFNDSVYYLVTTDTKISLKRDPLYLLPDIFSVFAPKPRNLVRFYAFILRL